MSENSLALNNNLLATKQGKISKDLSLGNYRISNITERLSALSLRANW